MNKGNQDINYSVSRRKFLKYLSGAAASTVFLGACDETPSQPETPENNTLSTGEAAQPGSTTWRRSIETRSGTFRSHRSFGIIYLNCRGKPSPSERPGRTVKTQ